MPPTTLPLNERLVLLDAVGAGAVTSTAYAVPYGGQITLAWQSNFSAAPDAISIQIQGSMEDVDAEYVVLDSSTTVGGEAKTILNVAYKWIRAKQVSKTGAVTTTVAVVAQRS